MPKFTFCDKIIKLITTKPLFQISRSQSITVSVFLLPTQIAGQGKYHKDDPQGEGGAFSVANGVTLLVVDTTVKNTQAGKKV